MGALLLDTHTWAWSLTGSQRLSGKAVEAIREAETIYVSPISFFEIGQKVRLGKWPEMEPLVASLPDILSEQGGLIATLTPEICLFAATMDWRHRDPFDRLLAATSLTNSQPLISIDTVFDTYSTERKVITRIWL